MPLIWTSCNNKLYSGLDTQAYNLLLLEELLISELLVPSLKEQK